MAAALTLPGGRAQLRGTFLQLWTAHKEWPDSRWTELFRYLRALGIKEIVIQWSRYDSIDYGPEIERVLQGGFDVWMGLGYDSAWWQRPSAEMILDSVRAVPRIAGVRGYYLPQELEASLWGDKQRYRAMAKAIRTVRTEFHPLAISCFTNRQGDPAELARFWRGLQRASRFDRLLFQDGVGSGKMPLSEWRRWAAPLAPALGRRLTFVVETFTATGEGASWQAAPADWERITEQIAVARDICPNDILAFSAPEYMTPLGGEAAAKLFHHILLGNVDTHP